MLYQLMYTIEKVEQLLIDHYDLKAEIKALQGEADANFLIIADGLKKYTLKISPPGTPVSEVLFQIDILNYLSKQDHGLQLPTAVSTGQGKLYTVLADNSILRLQTWVEGRMMAGVNPRSDEILFSWGQAMGKISKAFQGYNHPSTHKFYKWNPSETLHSKKFISYFQNEDELEIASYFWNLFETDVQHKLPSLRQSVNHNDGHELNLLVDYNYLKPQITGIIDFGDALYTETINELAIACAYAGMNMPDPLEAITHVVRGYHDTFPIEEIELEVLFSLICARLMITVANAAHNKHQHPENEYLIISERPAWELLKKLRKVPPELAHFTFRHSCGYSAHPINASFNHWVERNQEQFGSIIKLDHKQVVQLDLTIGSTELGHSENYLEIEKFHKRINEIITNQNADYGIGGYLETRPFYTSDAYEVEGNNGAQWRTVHLGIDVWTENNCPVYAPWEGVVYSVYDNAGDCDYGPTIILAHKISSQLTFYTLYGHLSNTSLHQVTVGQEVHKGDLIAHVGAAPHNGNWPPHLHFQIMLNMLGNEHDFPGVAYPDQVDIWSSICPDPIPWFKFEFSNQSDPNAKEIRQIRNKNVGKSLSLSYNKPLHIVRGYKQHLYDINGRRYLDTANNVAHVGHQHQRVTDAATRQIHVLNTNTRYLHKNLTAFAKALTDTLPEELSVVHFVNSGSEANELALRMAKITTGQKDMLAVEVGYHGNTAACIDVSSYKFDGKGGQGTPDHTHLMPIPDIYRGLHREASTAGVTYAAYAHGLIQHVKSQGNNIAGFIGESILSCGGQIVLPQGYLQELYTIIRTENGICIADEVQVGIGRVGEHFWGFQLQNVVPDIVTIGKPIGNGHPLGAVVCTPEIAVAFANGMEYFNTFGGNPVSCAIGHEVLAIVQDEGLQENALTVGNYLQVELRKLQSKHHIIGAVRGHGLFLGFELVRDRSTLIPADKECTYLANRMRERGILISIDGPYHNVIKIKPPMCFSKTDANKLIYNLDLVLSEDYIRLGHT